MACYHLTLKVMSRKGSAGRSSVHGAAYRSGGRGATLSRVQTVGGVSAVAAAAYRAGEVLQDERLGRTYDYARKEHILHTEIVLPEGDMPTWAHDRAQLWNAVERAERRKDAVVAREVEIMLPRELSMADQVTLVRRFVAEQFSGKGLVADFATHQPDASDGDPHPHCHLLITPRALTAAGFHPYKDQTFWWASKGEKSKDELEALRADWARMQNEALECAGAAARVDHRSLAAQRADALDRAAQAHAEGRLAEAARLEHHAQALHRVPQVPMGLSRRVREMSGHLKDRLGLWMARRHHQRLLPQIDALQRRGTEEFVRMARRVIDRAAQAFGVDPPTMNKGEPAHDR